MPRVSKGQREQSRRKDAWTGTPTRPRRGAQHARVVEQPVPFGLAFVPLRAYGGHSQPR